MNDTAANSQTSLLPVPATLQAREDRMLAEQEASASRQDER